MKYCHSIFLKGFKKTMSDVRIVTLPVQDSNTPHETGGEDVTSELM
jgi:hypothetical protein